MGAGLGQGGLGGQAEKNWDPDFKGLEHGEGREDAGRGPQPWLVVPKCLGSAMGTHCFAR